MLGGRIGIISSSNNTQSGSSPDQISNLQFWVDSQDNSTVKNASNNNAVNNDPVASWIDKSGNNRHFIQNTVGYRPLYKTIGINNHPAILFNGANLLTNNYSIGVNNFTIITVHLGGSDCQLWTVSVNIGNENFYPSWSLIGYLGNAQGDSWIEIPGGFDTSFPWILVTRYRTTPSNSVLLKAWSTSTGATTPVNEQGYAANFTFNGGFGISKYNGEMYSGYVGEIIIYNRSLTDTEIQNLSIYLKNKWNI